MKSSNKCQMAQPYKILTDIYGVITSWDFTYMLYSYIEDNLEKFLTDNWTQEWIQDFTERVKQQSVEDKQRYNDLPLILSPEDNSLEDLIQSVVDNIKYRESTKLKTCATDVQALYDSIWMDGYTNGQLTTHAFDDVMPALSIWTSHETDLEAIKIYTFASGPPVCQKRFLSSTICGDLSQYITCCINSFHKYKYDSNKYKAVISSVLERTPKNILYLTDRPRKAKAATEAGMRTVIVLRPGNKQYSEEEMNGFLTITSLEDLEFT